MCPDSISFVGNEFITFEFSLYKLTILSFYLVFITLKMSLYFVCVYVCV